MRVRARVMGTTAMRTMMDTLFIIIFMAFVFMAVAGRVMGLVSAKVEWAWEGGEVLGMGHVGEGRVNDNYSIDISLTWLLLSTSLLLLVWVRRQEEGQDGRCENPTPSSTLSITKAVVGAVARRKVAEKSTEEAVEWIQMRQIQVSIWISHKIFLESDSMFNSGA